MPETLDEYVANLPEIYRDILAVFPEVDPSRKMGYELATSTITVALNNKWSLEEIQEASSQLAAKGLAEIRHSLFVRPTPLGEEIIARLTGHRAAKIEVPALTTPPPWRG